MSAGLAGDAKRSQFITPKQLVLDSLLQRGSDENPNKHNTRTTKSHELKSTHDSLLSVVVTQLFARQLKWSD